MRAGLFAALLVFGGAIASAQVQSPEEFLGHQVGADYKLVKWERIVEYFRHLDENSDRIAVRDIGLTTEGRPMILAEISTADTVANHCLMKCPFAISNMMLLLINFQQSVQGTEQKVESQPGMISLKWNPLTL